MKKRASSHRSAAGDAKHYIEPIASTCHINYQLGVKNSALVRALMAAARSDSNAIQKAVRDLAVPDGIVIGRFEPEESGFEASMTGRASGLGQMYNVSVQGPTLATEWARDLEEFMAVETKQAGLLPVVGQGYIGFNECAPLDKAYLVLFGMQDARDDYISFRYVPMTTQSVKKHTSTQMKDRYTSAKISMLGAWKMGPVMDTSASRIFTPSAGSKLQRARGTSGITLAVNPEWLFSADFLREFE
jgi:hypothetical protein